MRIEDHPKGHAAVLSSAPDKGSREPIGDVAIEGKVTRFDGETGHILPNAEVLDPRTNKPKREIFFHKSDIENGQEPRKGAEVSFFLYVESNKNLGAEGVCVIVQGPEEEPTPDRRIMKSGNRLDGTVQFWGDKDNLCWIRPRKRSSMKGTRFQGCVSASQQDIQDGAALWPGDDVTFVLFRDPQGNVCAQEVSKA